MSTIGINDFVRRQTASSEFTHFDEDWGRVAALAVEHFAKARPGYRDGVVLVPVPPEGFHTGLVSLQEGDRLVGEYKARTPGEEPRKAVRAAAEGRIKRSCVAVDVVLYRRDVLAENDEATTDCDAEGKHVTPDVATKLFSLSGRVTGGASGSAPTVLNEIRDELRGFRLEDLQSRNEEFFREEEDKLDRWAEDVKFGLERELRELDTLIKAAKKTSKSAVALAEKLDAQKQIKTLEAKRNTKRRQLFDAQDDVDKKRAELIEEIERQLQTKTRIEPVFTLHWTLRDGAGTTA